jgi:hypothetical protein
VTERARRASRLALAALALGGAAPASAAEPAADAVDVHGVALRPSLELRLRGELRTAPVDLGGARFGESALLDEGDGSGALPVVAEADEVDDETTLLARTRLGLTASRGPVTAVVTIQDARPLGADTGAALRPAGAPELPSLAPFEVFVAIDLRRGDTSLRVGRQRVVWGDGRLLGESDWSATPRSLDAVRFQAKIRDLDVDLFSALLAAPGEAITVRDAGDEGTPPHLDVREGSGAQLHGARLAWHLAPLLQPELAALARVVRDPVPASLAPGDTFVFDARLSGDYRGLRYAIEGAYEVGRLATVGDARDLSAFAGAARVSLETALPWRVTFGADGSYATGDESPLGAHTTQRRFDPILPDEHEHRGAMGLVAWSNALELGGHVAARPRDDLAARVGYRHATLAEPGGRWTTAALVPVGAAPTNREASLGHELEGTLAYQPFEPMRVDAGYGLFLFGEGAKAILRAEGRGARSAQHWGFLQVTVRLP